VAFTVFGEGHSIFMKHTIRVRLSASPDRSYNIQVEPGILGRLSAEIMRVAGGGSVFVIADSTVARLYGSGLRRSLTQAGLRSFLFRFPAGETSKNSKVVQTLHTMLLTHRVRRDDLIVALGGGVTGDLAGFVAATILRGIRFVQVPTSLLAQVDSSVGGKVGIDHPLGKNLIGAFHQPRAVFIDPGVLRTLSWRQFRNGLAEAVKIAAALDSGFFRWLERHNAGIVRRSPEVLASLVTRAAGLKAAVVERDEVDTGLRNVLNLGHTLGHAIESASRYRILHGEAVAIGMVLESGIAHQLGLLPESDLRRIRALMERMSLPTVLPSTFDRGLFHRSLQLDKKNVARQVRYVLLRSIGQSVVGIPVPNAMVERVIAP